MLQNSPLDASNVTTWNCVEHFNATLYDGERFGLGYSCSLAYVLLLQDYCEGPDSHHLAHL
jgi:hypothetical protein